MKKTKAIKYTVWIIAFTVFILLLKTTLSSTVQFDENYVPSAYHTILSLLPPAVAIALALITKEVYSSLLSGIITGALLYTNGNIGFAFKTMLYNESGGLISVLSDSQNVSILVFVVILSTLVALMNRSGGSASFGKWASQHIKSKTAAQLASVLFGIMIFVDDGFNCMTVGSVMRPITDRYKVSRSKLAYIIDSTAAPVCIIAPISAWAAAVTYSVPKNCDINGFEMFLRTIPFNFYALTTLFMLIICAVAKIEYGPMRQHEDNAKNGDLFSGKPVLEQDFETDKKEGLISDLILPVLVLLVSCVIGIVYTGGFFDGTGFIDAFANSNSAQGLVFGGCVTLIFTFVLYLCRGRLTLSEYMSCLPVGFHTMTAPMIILIFAWTLSGMTGLLGADVYVRDVVAGFAGEFKMFLPAIIFVISVFLSFSTGTSWGTFTILIPILCSVFADSYDMLTISISACLAGAVCGDHCSPISDTTIMSSAGACCDHINHVSTQLPYAVTAASVSLVGYIIAGIIGYIKNAYAALVTLPITLALLCMTLIAIKRTKKL